MTLAWVTACILWALSAAMVAIGYRDDGIGERPWLVVVSLLVLSACVMSCLAS